MIYFQIILALSYEAILFLVPSLQEENYNQRIDEGYAFHGNDFRIKPITSFRVNHIFPFINSYDFFSSQVP